MADVTDSAIAAAYDDVRSDKSETNFLLLDYAGEKSDKLTVTATGTGGLEELKGLLKDDKASFAYVRVKYSNDVESFREKFAYIVWLGSGIKPLRRAKCSVHSADVKNVIRSFSIEVPASSQEDLNEGPIVTRLRKAGGASYDRT
ncbi:hypothetical protein JCM8547_004146 [Rhodosporidiobolus lusitaniae]